MEESIIKIENAALKLGSFIDISVCVPLLTGFLFILEKFIEYRILSRKAGLQQHKKISICNLRILYTDFPYRWCYILHTTDILLTVNEIQVKSSKDEADKNQYEFQTDDSSWTEYKTDGT